jgi:hypothetical protein
MKLLGSFIAAAALAFSALVAVPTTATAAYPGTVATACSYAAPGTVRKNRNYKVSYRASASGNARPSGTAIFRVYQVKNGRLKLIRSFSNGYTGPKIRTKSLGKFKKKGRYASQFSFRPNKGSVYKSCATGTRSFRVKR